MSKCYIISLLSFIRIYPRSGLIVWGFDNCGRWINIICTAPCFKTQHCRCFCGSWPTMRWERSSSKQLSLKCTEQSKLYFEAFHPKSSPARPQLRSYWLSSGLSSLEWNHNSSLFFTFVRGRTSTFILLDSGTSKDKSLLVRQKVY